MSSNQIINITENVKWIGVTDPDLKTFDIVMQTKFGTTYNAYYINADKKTLIDSVKFKFWDEYYAKLSLITNPQDIKYIIVNHTEPDHSGSIQKLIEILPDITIVGSGNAIRYLSDILNCDFKHRIVKDNESIDLGNKSLRFLSTPNLHWPDTIYTWCEDEKVLFTCDSFGCHYCDDRIFDDLVGNFDEAFKYYFDVILKPFSKFMIKAIDKINILDIAVIAPGHGPVLRKNWKKYVDLSKQFAKEALEKPCRNCVFIPYVSAYGFTALLAEKIAEGVKKAGDINTDVCDIENIGMDIIENKLSSCSGIIVGSPTINQNSLLQIYQLFALINPVRDRSKLAACFGSYGWSGESENIIENTLKSLKLTIFKDNFFVKFKPSDEDLLKAVQFGKDYGEAFLKHRMV